MKFETMQLHAGHTLDETRSRAVPIYQTTSYVFENCQKAEDLFALRAAGDMYSRIGNPTVATLEARVAALEGGTAALAVSSGAAAVTYTLMNLAGVGGHIVSAATLYGGTYNLFTSTLPRYGIEATLIDSDEPENFERAIRDNTKALYLETVGNPAGNVADFDRIADIAHRHGLPLVIDNTFGSPYLFQPLAHGADIVVHSATKFLGGHGTTLGGVIVEGGTFDFHSNKFPGFTAPDEGYHGIVYADQSAPFTLKCRTQLLRDTGACLSPLSAFLILQGIETLSLRVERHVQNTERLIAYLKSKKEVKAIHYPTEGKYAPLAKKYFPRGAGSIFSLELHGGKEAAWAFIDALEIFSLLANVADAKSLVIHPATTTHGQLSPAQQAEAGITPGMIRVSVGLENVDDLIEDCERGFAALKAK